MSASCGPGRRDVSRVNTLPAVLLTMDELDTLAERTLRELRCLAPVQRD